VATEPNQDPVLSRGTFMVLGSIALLSTGLVVTLGTSAPLLTRFLENPGQVGPEFYNRVNFPLALGVAFLLSLVPFLTWRGETPARELAKKLAPAAIFALLATAVAAAVGVSEPFHLALVLLAAMAIATNVQKTIAKARAGGLKGAGGYLAHVGVGVILVGFLASSAYDESAKVTLIQGEPAKVGDLTLTFETFLERQGREKERAQVRVVRADGATYLAYPKIFLNDRTRQLMVHPDVKSLLLADLYLSPLEFDPGRRPGSLAEGEAAALGDVGVRFVGFDMGRDGGAMAQMAAGRPVTIAAVLEITRGGATSRLEPVYRFRSDGQVEFPPLDLPGGGRVALGGIDASSGAVHLLFAELGAGDRGVPARLSLDVTRKPLIQLVWWGFYVILAGGLLAIAARVRQVRLLDQTPTRPA
jgi:cytochrome c-type biogenesis protein CcmF